MPSTEAKKGIRGFLDDVASGLKTSQLAIFLAVLFLLDLFLLDPIPFVDEAILGLLTLLSARWRGRAKRKRATKDVTPTA